MNRFIVIVFCLLFSIVTYCQEKVFNSEKETQDFSEKLTLLFSQNKVLEAFNEMKVYWPLPETELELIQEKTVKSINIVETSFGKSIGIKKIKHHNLNDVFYRDVYFIRYKVTVLRFIYTYYNTDEGLILNSFKFDEDFEEEF